MFIKTNTWLKIKHDLLTLLLLFKQFKLRLNTYCIVGPFNSTKHLLRLVAQVTRLFSCKMNWWIDFTRDWNRNRPHNPHAVQMHMQSRYSYSVIVRSMIRLFECKYSREFFFHYYFIRTSRKIVCIGQSDDFYMDHMNCKQNRNRYRY